MEMRTPYFRLKSPPPAAPSINFQELQHRLRAFVVKRVNAGEYTERGLARTLGVSQPQLHNVLKGARVLKPEFADVLLNHFRIGVLDLIVEKEPPAVLMPCARNGCCWRILTQEKPGEDRRLPPAN
jgi:hypothetical protein